MLFRRETAVSTALNLNSDIYLQFAFLVEVRFCRFDNPKFYKKNDIWLFFLKKNDECLIFVRFWLFYIDFSWLFLVFYDV